MQSPKAVDKAQSIRKRLFVFCDGTWQDSVNRTSPLTNVATLARCLEGVADDGYLQISYYDNGIGNMTSLPAHLIDGATGRGISAKIRNAYSFLSHNYNFEQGNDEIFLIGFSRGAFTVQCLASFISQTGLLHKAYLYYLRGLFTLWANEHVKSSKKRDVSRVLGQFVRSFETGRVLSEVKIKACIVWDTVSSLGPLTPWARPFSCVGSTIPQAVENAFQALALNEARKPFRPSVWTSKESSETYAKQCWFLGSHADVGGNGDAALGAVTLVWVVGQLLSISKAKFNHAEIEKHLKHRLLEWKFDESRLLGRTKQKLSLSHRSSSGRATKHSPLWRLLGHEHRKLDAGVRHRNPGLDIETLVHFTVRLSMVRDAKACWPLRGWQTKLQNGSVYWEQNEKILTEDKVEQNDADLSYEYKTLKEWSEGKYKNMETERARFAALIGGSMYDPEEATRSDDGRFAAFLRDNMVFEGGRLAPGYMYNPRGAAAAVAASS